jgi:hypothetical protein
MYKNLLIIIILVVLVYGCTETTDNNETKKINGKVLSKLVEDALWGSSEANFKLSGLVRPSTPSPDKYNRLVIDSSVTYTGIKLYSVLIEYPNPLHNVLAVYNDTLNLFLQDNSLNGNLVARWDSISNKLYLITSENFISKDILKLSRLSLYAMIDDKFYMVFRSFTKLDKAGEIYQQTIENINSNAIVTRIDANKEPRLDNAVDTFYYNSSKHDFTSSENNFSTFILDEIISGKWTIEKPELSLETVDYTSNIIRSEVANQSDDIAVEMKGFQISLSSDWNNAIGIAVTDHLISKLEGIRYINEKLGAQITVINLPEGSSASQFVKYKFSKPTKGDYRVRSTNLLDSGNNNIQFFEHSCANKTFILLLQAPKYTFKKTKHIYDEIITSFFIEC